MTTEYTPGPWIADFENERTNEYGVHEVPISAKGIIDLASVYYNDYEDEKDDEGRANLSLIAAAPELLEALQGFLKVRVDPTELSDEEIEAIQRAKAAIKKATNA